jgi:hypothetical protein
VKLILIIVLSLIGVIVLIGFALWITGKLYDRWAVKSAKKYCIDNNLGFVEVKAFPNHYGLYFKKNNNSFYAPFEFERNRTITWKKGTPQNRIEQRAKRNSSAQSSRRLRQR